jgi:predicted RNA-binding protein with PUA-like domain
MARAHWLIKSEPETYAWATLVADKKTTWDGVRNFQARANLRAMKKGDLALFYHSGEKKEIVGVAKVLREAYQDPTTADDWSAVDFAPAFPLKEPVGLAAIKADKALKDMVLLRQGRLSVVPVKENEFGRVLELARTKLPA